MPRQYGGGGPRHQTKCRLMLLALASWNAGVLALPAASGLDDQKILSPIGTEPAARKLNGRFLHISGASN
jgi:endopolyphosphatase